MWADVVVFDPARVSDVATYDNLHPYASGIETVLVNGQVVVDGGDHIGATPGHMPRHVRP